MPVINLIIIILVGVAGGVAGGMGMGGGTLLIPMLTIFCGINQHSAQAINLVAFLPMSIAALVIHTTNNLVEYKKVPLIAIPALITGVICSFVALGTGSDVLKKCFGIFLTALGVFQLGSVIYGIIKAIGQKKLNPEIPNKNESAEKEKNLPESEILVRRPKKYKLIRPKKNKNE